MIFVKIGMMIIDIIVASEAKASKHGRGTPAGHANSRKPHSRAEGQTHEQTNMGFENPTRRGKITEYIFV